MAALSSKIMVVQKKIHDSTDPVPVLVGHLLDCRFVAVLTNETHFKIIVVPGLERTGARAGQWFDGWNRLGRSEF